MDNQAMLVMCETIKEVADEKLKIGIASLYDSDIYDIVERCKEKGVTVTYKDVDEFLADSLDNYSEGQLS